MLMEEILHHLGCQKLINNGRNHQPHQVQNFLPINRMLQAKLPLRPFLVSVLLQFLGVLIPSWDAPRHPGRQLTLGGGFIFRSLGR